MSSSVILLLFALDRLMDDHTLEAPLVVMRNVFPLSTALTENTAL